VCVESIPPVRAHLHQAGEDQHDCSDGGHDRIRDVSITGEHDVCGVETADECAGTGKKFPLRHSVSTMHKSADQGADQRGYSGRGGGGGAPG
jgi:hypothetical protein